MTNISDERLEVAAALEEFAMIDEAEGGNPLVIATERRAADLLRARSGVPAPVSEHPDDAAVDRFAAAMKAKLAKKRAEGRGGWEDKDQCSSEFLSKLLREHVEKGDPLDVGNLAMMLHQRGDAITPAPVSYPRLTTVRAHKHTCANVQIGSTHADKCDCGALDTAGNAIEVTSPAPVSGDMTGRAGAAMVGTDPSLIHPDDKGHRTRFSDASTYDEICVLCGATDRRGDNRLDKPCPIALAAKGAAPEPAPVSEEMVERAARAIAGTAYEGVYFTTRSREEYIDAEWRNHETDARTAIREALAAKGGQ